ncbi:hypothetical protein [Shewanella sp. GutDb-MelDb]|uniref:hypothetical protein n=1 Tax=Shewanella sp. GutDb-MelDb TaxID=2058316 RepID=UPI000C7AA9C8|nr:hypothetical protein [Shewanella sp. GutDb-MelDb]PKG57721.1 hypothetical protein CXF82_08075 [Shewanella sp. GutDb-MelDb]
MGKLIEPSVEAISALQERIKICYEDLNYSDYFINYEETNSKLIAEVTFVCNGSTPQSTFEHRTEHKNNETKHLWYMARDWND